MKIGGLANTTEKPVYSQLTTWNWISNQGILFACFLLSTFMILSIWVKSDSNRFVEINRR